MSGHFLETVEARSKTEEIGSRMGRLRRIFTGNPLFDPQASAASALSVNLFNLDLAKCPDFRG
jgi:hypothetical protein